MSQDIPRWLRVALATIACGLWAALIVLVIITYYEEDVPAFAIPCADCPTLPVPPIVE